MKFSLTFRRKRDTFFNRRHYWITGFQRRNSNKTSVWRVKESVVSKMADNEVSEELDYHISFPSPVPDDISGDEDDDFYNQDNQQKEPVVILLGWMGCQDKYLANYSAIYEQRKCITIRYTLSVDKLFYKKDLVHPTAVKILEMIEDLSLEESPILFHVMSNAGCILYRHITAEVQSNPRFSTLKIRGCVFDSCPSRPTIAAAVKAFYQSLQLNVVATYFMTLLFALFMCGKALLRPVLSPLGVNLGQEEEDYYSALECDPAEWPQLFLYSVADQLVPYSDIDQVIAARRRKGVLVLSTCWEDSEHVAHLRAHRETYIKQCYDFLDICLAAEDEEVM